MTADATPPATDDLTLAAAAEHLGVHYMTAYRYVRTGLLEAEQRGGQWWVAPQAIDAFVAGRQRHPARPGRRGQGTARSAERRAHLLGDRLVAGDQAGAWALVDEALVAGADLTHIYLDVLASALRSVGDRWEVGELTVADEHRATGVATRVIGRLGVHCTRPGRPRGSVVLAAAPGDRHGLPTAILADLLRARGLRVSDLGADTPAEEVAMAASGEDRLLAVGLCATTPLSRSATRELARAVDRVRAEAGVPVLVGGSGITSADQARGVGADHWSHAAHDAIAWFEDLTTNPRPTQRTS